MQIHKQLCTACFQESLTINKKSIPNKYLVTTQVLVQKLSSQDDFFSVKSKKLGNGRIFDHQKFINCLTVYVSHSPACVK